MGKIKVLTAIILSAAIVGLLVYFFWQRSQEIFNPPQGNLPSVAEQGFSTSTNGGTPLKGRLAVLTPKPILSYWIYTPKISSSSIFYLTDEGNVFNISGEQISQKSMTNIQTVESSLDGKHIFVKYGEANNPSFVLFNLETKIWQDMPSISAAAFSSESNRIAYLEGSGESSNLIIRDLFGTKPRTQKVLTLYQKDFDLNWTKSNKIIFSTKPSADYEGQIWSIDLSTKNFNLLASGAGIKAGWSRDGNVGLLFRVKNNSPSLSLIDASGKILANLDTVTLPYKCLILEPKIYCGLPQSYSSKTEPILPDDYLKKKVYFNDFIYLMDINKNSLEPLWVGQAKIDVWMPRIWGNSLLFINRYDSKLYSLGL